MDSAAIREIRRLREWRAHDTRRLDLTDALDLLARRTRARGGAIEGAANAWALVAPQDLAARARVVSVRRGVLTIVAADASTRYAVDLWLRGGGLASLRSSCSAPITRTHVVLGSGPRR